MFVLCKKLTDNKSYDWPNFCLSMLLFLTIDVDAWICIGAQHSITAISIGPVAYVAAYTSLTYWVKCRLQTTWRSKDIQHKLNTMTWCEWQAVLRSGLYNALGAAALLLAILVAP